MGKSMGIKIVTHVDTDLDRVIFFELWICIVPFPTAVPNPTCMVIKPMIG